jgi:RNA polymerase sigma-70 factor (ECF subfamily)
MQDDALIKQAQMGEAKAFEQLLQQQYDSLFKFAFHWCGNRTDAEDIAQQACIKLARGINQFRFESSFSTWLYRLVINCAKDWQKSHARYQTVDPEDYVIDTCHDEHLDQTVLIQQLFKHLESVSDGMKETALLVHAEGFTHRETAAILGVKESTISWRIHEIRKQLHSLFGQEKS